MLLLDLLIGMIISVPFGLLAWRIGSVTLPGAITGIVCAGVIYAGLYLAGWLALGTALTLTIVSSRIGREKKKALGIAENRGGRRGAPNIVANCLVGTLGAAAELLLRDWYPERSAMWCVAGIAAGASDTVASEIGTAWGKIARTFPNWRPANPGTPGAISMVGTIAGMISATLIAMPAAVLWLIPWTSIPIVVVACTCGSFLESALATWIAMRPETRISYSVWRQTLEPHSGPRREERAESHRRTSQGQPLGHRGHALGWFEARGALGNHALNLINTAAAAAIGVTLAVLI